MKSEKYHITIRILHWLMAFIIIGLIVLGYIMTSFGEDLPNRGLLYGLHKSFGVTIIMLALIRIGVRLFTIAPRLSKGISKPVRTLARSAHYLIYLFFLAVPISGYAMSNYFGYNVSLFGIELPKIFPDDKEMGKFFHETHELLAYSFLAVILLHISGALKHRFFDKPENDVLKHMV